MKQNPTEKLMMQEEEIKNQDFVSRNSFPSQQRCKQIHILAVQGNLKQRTEKIFKQNNGINMQQIYIVSQNL